MQTYLNLDLLSLKWKTLIAKADKSVWVKLKPSICCYCLAKRNIQIHIHIYLFIYQPPSAACCKSHLFLLNYLYKVFSYQLETPISGRIWIRSSVYFFLLLLIDLLLLFIIIGIVAGSAGYKTNITAVTSGLYSQPYNGCIRNVSINRKSLESLRYLSSNIASGNCPL